MCSVEFRLLNYFNFTDSAILNRREGAMGFLLEQY